MIGQQLLKWPNRHQKRNKKGNQTSTAGKEERGGQIAEILSVRSLRVHHSGKQKAPKKSGKNGRRKREREREVERDPLDGPYFNLFRLRCESKQKISKNLKQIRNRKPAQKWGVKQRERERVSLSLWTTSASLPSSEEMQSQKSLKLCWFYGIIQTLWILQKFKRY